MYKVLIVDDEPFIQEGLHHIIHWEELGLEITGQAFNGAEAMKVLQATKVDILITDIKMPKMNGLELIREIRRQELPVKCIVLSGYDDFGLVKEAAKLGIENYILKPLDENELTHTLDNTINKIEAELVRQAELAKGIHIIRDNILYRWVTDDIAEDELLERAAFLNIQLEYHEYCVINMNMIEENRPAKASDKNLQKSAVFDICHQLISEKHSGVLFYDLNRNIVAVLWGDHLSDGRQLIRETLAGCASKARDILNTSLFITVGSFGDTFQKVPESYTRAKNLQEYKLILPASNIIFFDDIAKLAAKRQEDIRIDFKVLSSYILGRNRNAISRFIDDAYFRLKGLEGITPSYIQNVTIDLLFHVISTVKSMKSNSDALINEFRDIFSHVFEIKDADELNVWLKNTVNRYIDFVAAEQEKTSPIIRKVLDYIQNNYSQDISLKTLSSEFNINALYLGQLFRKETGDSFTNYLNSVRIEKAKVLLLNTNYKANEISSQIGYVNPNYFYTLFKKMTGVSPSEFKKE